MSAVRRWSRRASVWVTGFVLAGSLYLLLIDNTDLPELIVGAGVAVAAATGFSVAREQYLASETIRLRWLARIIRPILDVPSDIVAVSWTALTQLRHPQRARGEFRAVPFRCLEEGPREIGRRALAESWGSFAPNTIVIGVDPEQERLLGHQLRRGGGDDAIDVLRLGDVTG